MLNYFVYKAFIETSELLKLLKQLMLNWFYAAK